MPDTLNVAVVTPTKTKSPKSPEIELKPTSALERVNSLDIIRGIAVLGILTMNIVGFGLAFAYDDPTIAGGSEGWNYIVWAFNELFFEGTMRGLFTILFGVGFMIFVSRGVSKGAGLITADYYYRRMLWLMIFGLFHAYFLLWHGEILFTYAICGMTLFAFRTVKPKYLLILGFLVIMIGTARFYYDHQTHLKVRNFGMQAEKLAQQNIQLSDEQNYYLNEWNDQKSKRRIIEQENEILQESGYLTILKHNFPRTMRNQTINLYKYNVWDSLSFILFGIAFFSWRIFHAGRTRKFYLRMIIIGYAVGLAINFYELNLITSNNFETLAFSKAKLTYHFGRLAMTMGHIGLIVLFIKSGILKWLQNSLSSVGKMAFTNYLVQTIICGFIFLGIGFGLFGKLQRYELYFIVFGIWIIQLIYSPLWLKYFRYGPIEWLWRSLTYSKIQPIMK
jgi:uncharacterized protein